MQEVALERRQNDGESSKAASDSTMITRTDRDRTERPMLWKTTGLSGLPRELRSERGQ